MYRGFVFAHSLCHPVSKKHIDLVCFINFSLFYSTLALKQFYLSVVFHPVEVEYVEYVHIQTVVCMYSLSIEF